MKRYYIFVFFTLFTVLASLAQEKKIDGITYRIIDDKSVSVISIKNAGSDIVIPTTVEIKGRPYIVTKVQSLGLNDYDNIIRSIIVPNSVRSLEKCAFRYLDALTHITLSGNYSPMI